MRCRMPSFLVFAILLLWVAPNNLGAQIQLKEIKDLPVQDDEYRDVAAALRCPTCTGVSVLDSDASFSVQIKNEVKQQLAAGKHKNEIIKFFTDRYGPWILREPPKEGVHMWAWILPTSLLLLGPILIWYFVWSRRSQQPSDGISDVVPLSLEEIVSQMQKKLAQLREEKKEDGK